ncbi:hypothetical protein GCM10025867_48740 (plasmid) [Frondihabitans sucicola]|uniref:DUF6927 domain-containing protein n=1 Tax=Frondihabitans sucicola TaxID=1268041 RepID=A0ABM8GVX4_9MICO|nr:hypothetical protein [Frondihabitans sucicola]BDZ52633.1 hypothetical protein GCM10025867_48740 [Frondihabitans sucicola]
MTWNATPIGRGRPAGISDAEFFTNHEDLTEDGAFRLLDTYSTKRAFYVAREALSGSHEDVGSVSAVVVSKEWTRSEFGWKVEHETLNPAPIYTTIAMLDRLTPTEDLAANIWRERATAFAHRPVATVGDTIALTEPHKFSDGVRRGTFEVVGHGEMHSLDDGRTVRIDDWREREYTIVAVAAQPDLLGLVTVDDMAAAETASTLF